MDGARRMTRLIINWSHTETRETSTNRHLLLSRLTTRYFHVGASPSVMSMFSQSSVQHDESKTLTFLSLKKEGKIFMPQVAVRHQSDISINNRSTNQSPCVPHSFIILTPVLFLSNDCPRPRIYFINQQIKRKDLKGDIEIALERKSQRERGGSSVEMVSR